MSITNESLSEVSEISYPTESISSDERFILENMERYRRSFFEVQHRNGERLREKDIDI